MRMKPKWEIVETIGAPPQPRKSNMNEFYSQQFSYYNERKKKEKERKERWHKR